MSSERLDIRRTRGYRRALRRFMKGVEPGLYERVTGDMTEFLRRERLAEKHRKGPDYFKYGEREAEKEEE